MIYGSVCSGIEAASVAWEPLGWKPAWFSEIEKFPCEVLKYRYPEISNLGDMTKLHDNKLFKESKIDLLVGGTPCQSFSVAGLRKGLGDPRGNLCLEFLRLVDLKHPRWFVWENVPGVLSSSGGRDFGSFLGAVQKLGYGFAYRILDAQYYGVPQRRRRVFVVGHLGDWRRATAVLFEREGLCGNTSSRRKKREETSNPTSESTVGCLQARDYKGVGSPYVDEGKCIVQNIHENQRAEVSLSDTMGTLKCLGGKPGQGYPAILTFDRQSSGEYGTDTVASTVSARDYKSAADLVTIGFNWMENQNFKAEEEVTNPLRKSQTEAVYIGVDQEKNPMAETSGPLLARGRQYEGFVKTSQVRRLTPRECERLQGFPDDYTLLPNVKADGVRYKALGNSMAVPCMRWIGERIRTVEYLFGK